MCAILIFSKVEEKPKLVRMCAHLLIVRNIVPFYDLEKRKTFDFIDTIIIFSLTQS